MPSPPSLRMHPPYTAVAPGSEFSVVGELTVVDGAFKLEPKANLFFGGGDFKLLNPNFQAGVGLLNLQSHHMGG